MHGEMTTACTRMADVQVTVVFDAHALRRQRGAQNVFDFLRGGGHGGFVRVERDVSGASAHMRTRQPDTRGVSVSMACGLTCRLR